MYQERLNAIKEELQEVQSLPELKAIWCDWLSSRDEAAEDAECHRAIKEVLPRLRLTPRAEPVPQVVEQFRTTAPPVQRASRKYVLLKKDVGWSTKPQVHNLMTIIAAHVNEGEEVDEADIIRMVEANAEVLATKQPPRRIWDYYKGDHNEGLAAHGNVRKV